MDHRSKTGKPFFCYFNSTRMHILTHLKPQSQGKTGLDVEPDGMVEHEGQVGQLLKKLDDLRIPNNTIVVYTSDNGAEVMTWPGREHAIPRRKGHQLGRWLSCAHSDSLAERHQVRRHLP
jgi:arylsulfatase A-like enzyme